MKNSPLSELCEAIFLGRPPLPKGDNRHQPSLPAIGLRALDVVGGINLSDLDYIEETGSISPEQRIQQGDVLLAVRGSLGKAAIITETLESPVYITANIAALRVNSSLINPFYLWLWLQSALQRNIPAFKRSTTGQQSVSLGDLKKMQIPVAPMTKQRQIQSAVEAMLKFRRNQRQQEAKVEEFFGSFMEEVFPNE